MRRHTTYEPRQGATIHGLGEHIDNPLKIEVHTAVAEPLPVTMVSITPRLYPPRTRPGVNAYPSAGALMLHLLLHATGNIAAHALRQIQLHDIAELARRLSDADWTCLLAARRRREKLWWAFPPLALTARYYERSIPPEILRELRASCPLPLRFATDRKTLTDVSWSNLRIHAFPAIAWSRTPLEALRYVRKRALPSRESIAELHTALQAAPLLKPIRWYALPHSQRIVRWLFSRPPRVQTISSVMAALRDSAV